MSVRKFDYFPLTVSCCSAAKFFPTLCDHVDCSLAGSSVHGILQTTILEWVVISLSTESSQLRDQTWVCCTGRQILSHWATRSTMIKILQSELISEHLFTWIPQCKLFLNGYLAQRWSVKVLDPGYILVTFMGAVNEIICKYWYREYAIFYWCHESCLSPVLLRSPSVTPKQTSQTCCLVCERTVGGDGSRRGSSPSNTHIPSSNKVLHHVFTIL